MPALGIATRSGEAGRWASIGQILNLQSFIPHLLLFIFAIFLAEFTFQNYWNKRYFKYGLSIFRIKCKNSAKYHELPIKQLEKKFNGIDGPLGIPIIPAIKFGHINDRVYGFREKFTFCSMYLPILHGAIEFNPVNEKMTFYARLNYFPFITFAVICPTIIEVADPGEKGWIVPLSLYIVFLFVQLIRYSYIYLYIKYLFRKSSREEAQGH